MSFIALYYRLSAADGDLGKGGRDESNSIENQRKLALSFMEPRDDLKYRETREYIDDGYTGSNFDRPAFKRMIDGVKNGNVDTIIVKDFSRFGRNYIGVGEFLEITLPLFRVRFISINDRYDSDNISTATGIEIPIKNLVNMMHSKDTSIKIYAANKIKWEKGRSTSGKVPFGYIHDPESKGRYAIDPEAAKIVRHIFDLALEGMDTIKIAARLNDEGCLIPSEYNRIHRAKAKETAVMLNVDKIWDREKVRKILRTEEYTGTMILGKRRKINGKQRIQPREEWFITPNVNDAIITAEEFEQAQEVIRHVSKMQGFNESTYSLKGKVRCGHCRCLMQYRDNHKVWCATGRQQLKSSGCSPERFLYDNIENIVFSDLKQQLTLVKELGTHPKDKTDIIKKMEQAAAKKRQRAKRKIQVLKHNKMMAYEAYAEDKKDLSWYNAEKERIDAEIEQLKKTAEDTEAEITQAVTTAGEEDKERTDIAKGVVVPSMQMSDAFVEGVYVHEDGVIEIRYRFDDHIMDIYEETGA